MEIRGARNQHLRCLTIHKATYALQLHIPDRREVGVNVDACGHKVKESAAFITFEPAVESQPETAQPGTSPQNHDKDAMQP